MQTYSIDILREAFSEVIDTEKFVQLTYFIPKRRALKIKGKITGIHASPEGLAFTFNNVYIKRKPYFQIRLLLKNIRWVTSPFDMEKVEELCKQLQKKLPPRKDSGTSSPVNRVLDDYIR